MIFTQYQVYSCLCRLDWLFGGGRTLNGYPRTRCPLEKSVEPAHVIDIC